MSKQFKLTYPVEGLALVEIGADAGQLNEEDLALELNEVCQEINYNTAIRTMLITGKGDAFYSVALAGEKKQQVIEIAAPVAAIKCPVIAAINADAIGHGLALALAADIRICSEQAHFAVTGIKQGFMPDNGLTQRLPRVIGKAQAAELLLTGRMMDAREALRIGLVTRVFKKEELRDRALEMGKEMAGKAVMALRYCKEAVLKGQDMTIEQGMLLEADLYFLLHTTEDRVEGINAFREKRKPEFKGK